MAHILPDGSLDPNADQDCLRPTNGVKSIEDLRHRLSYANAWRRGGDGPMPDPRTLGTDIDTVTDILKTLDSDTLTSSKKIARCRKLSMDNDKRKERRQCEQLDAHQRDDPD